MPTIRIPTPLRPLVKGQSEVRAQGATVREALQQLVSEHQGIGERIYDAQGQLRRFVNVFLNDEDIRAIGGLDAKVKDGDVLSIVPAIAGGA